MPKFTEVWPRLWIGGSNAPVPAGAPEFDLLVTVCEEWEVWFTPEAEESISSPITEGTLDGTDPADIDRSVGVVVRAYREDRTVLVRCRIGHERSAMIVALALMELTGRSAREVVADLRARHTDEVLAVPASEFLAHVLNSQLPSRAS